jgi:hypothetical protein
MEARLLGDQVSLLSFGCSGYFLGQSSRVESPQVEGDIFLSSQIDSEVVMQVPNL